MEKQSGWPVLTAFGQHYYQGMRDQFDFLDGGEDRFFLSGMIGIQLQVPLFNGFAKQSRIRLKEAELQQVDLKREQMLMSLTAGYAEAVQNHRNSLLTLDMEQENLEAAKIIYQTNLAGYKQHVVSLTDLILSEYQLTKSRMELYHAHFAVQKAELTLRKIDGQLIKPYL
jgi:outer membrane protein TolC